ncbi:ATP-binding cassette domain-containing protein [Weeksella virosa]|uniref:ATP-binding cassette domain-containing protein n=1 Tax=Weeksella virosa TaxID=1014 RepID=UPI00255620D1|nr:ATP-binding cassette domain-containing protein [Weeksella virosa]MDK7374894.1 ATP-binding cassette domain-containing protein [Weeksella virosa]
MKIKIDRLIPKPLETFGFDDSMIWDKTYEFEKENHYQIIAPSGVGKSTLINILYGIRKDYTGRVWFDEQDIRDFSVSRWTHERNTRLAYVFQGLHLFEELTLMENILLKNNLTNFCTKEKIENWIDRVGLSKHLYQKAAHLSYGQRQRIAVVRALCQPFDFLLLDEPFSHLDTENSQVLLDIIFEESLQQNAGIILTTLHPINDKRIQHAVTL